MTHITYPSINGKERLVDGIVHVVGLVIALIACAALVYQSAMRTKRRFSGRARSMRRVFSFPAAFLRHIIYCRYMAGAAGCGGSIMRRSIW